MKFIGQAFGDNHSIEILGLGKNYITMAGVVHLCKYLCPLKVEDQEEANQRIEAQQAKEATPMSTSLDGNERWRASEEVWQDILEEIPAEGEVQEGEEPKPPSYYWWRNKNLKILNLYGNEIGIRMENHLIQDTDNVTTSNQGNAENIYDQFFDAIELGNSEATMVLRGNYICNNTRLKDYAMNFETAKPKPTRGWNVDL